MSQHLAPIAANLVSLLAPSLKDDHLLTERLIEILGHIEQLPLRQHRFQPIAWNFIESYALITARESPIDKLPSSIAHRLVIDFLIRTHHILSTLQPPELDIYRVIVAFAATFESAPMTIDQMHQESPTTLTRAQIDAAIEILGIRKMIAGSPQAPHTDRYAPIVSFFYAPTPPNELLSSPWKLIYKDLFEMSSPAEVEAQGKGLIAGLKDLWLSHLATGVHGLSRFTLNCQTPPRQFEITSADREILLTLRRWLYRESDEYQPVNRETVDGHLLQTMATTHARLILSGKPIDPILHLALTAPNIFDFTCALETLLSE